MDFQSACTFGAAISEDLVRPPAFKIPATPNAHVAHMTKLQCAIHPTAASPFRWAHVPIRMIIERNNDDRPGNAAQPERRQIMKIARAVKQKGRREVCFVVAIKLGDQARRRREAQLWSPIAHVSNRQAQGLILPRIIELEMKTARRKVHGPKLLTVGYADLSRNPGFRLFCSDPCQPRYRGSVSDKSKRFLDSARNDKCG